MTSSRTAWEATYRLAEYRVELPRGAMVLRVDLHDAGNDERLRREAGVESHWALLTPCNPGSQPLSAQDNAALLAQLLRVVEERQLRGIGSVNHDPTGQWPDEAGLLLCDPPQGLAEQIGRGFRQNAILAARLGEAPRLVWLVD